MSFDEVSMVALAVFTWVLTVALGWVLREWRQVLMDEKRRKERDEQ